MRLKMNWERKEKKAGYVVFVGHIPGLYETWPECKGQVNGFSRARFKGYATWEAAKEAWENFKTVGTIDTRHRTKPTRKRKTFAM